MLNERTTIVIANFNGARHLAALLPSIAAQTRPPARVVVVDNGSSDDSIHIVAGQADVISLPKNHGFAFAVNRGIESATTEFVAIVNNDVVLDRLWLQILEDALLGEQGSSSYACPLLLSASSDSMIDGTYDLLSSSGCALRAFHNQDIGCLDNESKRRIHFPPMTAALFRKKLFDEIGLLDESFKNYLEDVEFGLRAAISGNDGVFVPAARAVHIGSATLGAWSAAASFWNARNQLLLVARHYPSTLIRKWWWKILVGNTLYLVLALRRGCLLAALRGKVDALRSWRSLRRSSPAGRSIADAQKSQRLRSILESSELQIATLHRNQRNTATSRFWDWYFFLAGPPEGNSR